jgi:hypothetical protein
MGVNAAFIVRSASRTPDATTPARTVRTTTLSLIPLVKAAGLMVALSFALLTSDLLALAVAVDAPCLVVAVTKTRETTLPTVAFNARAAARVTEAASTPTAAGVGMIGSVALHPLASYLSVIGRPGRIRPMHETTMTDYWDGELRRLAREATVLSLAMVVANGRDDGEHLEQQAATVVGGLFLLRLTAAIRAAGGRRGADTVLRVVPEIGPGLSEVLERLTTDVTGPDTHAQDWLRENGEWLERAFIAARLAHIAGTAIKMNSVETFRELRGIARWPHMLGYEGTSEDIAISVMSAKARQT